jgi:hypothetical protein
LGKLCEEADAIALGAPVYWGDINGLTKDFMDIVKIPYTTGKPALGIAIAGGSGKGLLSGVQSIYHFFYHKQMRGIDPTPVSRFNLDEALGELKISGAKLAEVSKEKTPFPGKTADDRWPEVLAYYASVRFLDDDPLDEFVMLSQQLIKIVKEEMITLMGSEEGGIRLSGSPPVPIMLVGLHGCGKTTTAGKLAKYFQDRKKRPYLIPADVYRPAAIEQLQKLGEDLRVDFYRPEPSQAPLDICLKGRDVAQKQGYDLILIDTAGRLHIDEALMLELREIKTHLKPKEILLVADAMTGQDAVNIAKISMTVWALMESF